MSSLKKIRNFSIIAHIDHGKTTLTDQFLQLTKTVTPQDFKERMMDSNPIEQERGVTIKLAPVRMKYQQATQEPAYILNLIDTPGHVDFGYEVNRSLQACEGAILLVDATQGIQAQTLANFEKAQKQNLKIIPVINKVDLPSAEIEATMLEMMETFKVKEKEILLCSAKTGQGVEQILQAVIDRVPAPTLPATKNTTHSATKENQSKTKALIITSKYDNHLGAIAYVRLFSGQIKQNQELALVFSQTQFRPTQMGFFTPKQTPTQSLKTGEVGYIATGLKDISHVKIGDTITLSQDADQVQPLPGFKEPTPMVFMELYPIDNDKFRDLKDGMAKLKLHDAALQYSSTHSQALGNGLSVGFLGIFHAEIIRERLQREFNLELISTAPSVKYQVKTKTGQTETISSPGELPDPSQIEQIKEPITKTFIFAPVEYLPSIMEFIRKRRGVLKNTINVGTRAKLEFMLPLSELIIDFHDKLKSLTSGFASLEYEVVAYEAVDAVKVDILVNKEVVEALSFITINDQAETRGRELVEKLKEVIPKQLFEIPIQAALGGKIIARETVKAYRKDVTAKLYGGDRTRRMKLLKQQSEGKKRMKKFGEVELNQEAFLAVLKR